MNDIKPRRGRKTRGGAISGHGRVKSKAGEPAAIKDPENVYVKLEVPVARYSENTILDLDKLQYDPDVKDPSPHDPHAGTFESPTVAVTDQTPGPIRCYNEYELSAPTSRESDNLQETPPQPASSCHTLLPEFTGKDWPTSTSVHCWWCCHGFTTVPIGVPFSYVEATDSFQVLGCFCGFSCASAYMRNDRRGVLVDKLFLLHYMHRKVMGSDAAVKPSPPREMLKKFGGPFNVDDFRSMTLEGRNFQVRLSPQLVPLGMVGEDMNFDNKGGVLQLLKKNGREKNNKSAGKGNSAFGKLFKIEPIY